MPPLKGGTLKSHKSKRKPKAGGGVQVPVPPSGISGRVSRRLGGLQLGRHPRFVLIALVVAVVAATWGTWHFSRRQSHIEGIQNVVLVSIDTCRADHLSCYGYSRETTPNIDALARDGVLFKSVFTPVPITLPAHSSMLTGTYPPIHGVRLNVGYRVGDTNVTLAESMQAAGYQTAAFIGGFPLDSSFGLNQGFQTYDDDFSGGGESGPKNERKAEEVNRLAMTWLEKHNDKPFFLFLHYYDPHASYVPPPPFASTYADDPYAGEIAYVDMCIGQVLDKLRSLGLYDNTLIIVTGDHGEGLGEHGERYHGFLIYQSTLHVPLIVRVPRGSARGDQVNEDVSLVDIVPTVLGLIGLSTPREVQGVDLRGYLEGIFVPERQQPIYSESEWPNLYGCSPLYSIVDGAWKYIQFPKPELYDLSRDGGEKVNVVGKEPQIAHRLQGRLEESQKAMDSAPDRRGNVPLDKEAIRRLESLGYVGGGVVRGNPSSDLRLEDPKDFLPMSERFETLNILVSEKRYQEAKKQCLEIISLRPEFFMPYGFLGWLALKERRTADAMRHLSTAMSILTELKDNVARSSLGAGTINYFIASCHRNLGEALILEGKLDQAVIELKSALRIDPEFFRNHYNLGLVLQKQGKVDEAIAHYQKALKIKPHSAPAHRRLSLALQGQGKFTKAVVHYQKAIANYQKTSGVIPDYALTVNNLAWLLATCSDASVRDGNRAVKLAKKAIDLSGGKSPAILDTLAAAYAETQQFQKAVATAQEAVALAKSAKQAILASRIQSHLDLYRAGRPYREMPRKPSPAPVSP